MKNDSANISFFNYVEKYPPILCRLLARSRLKGPPRSTEQIARLAGLPLLEVTRLSQHLDWSAMSILEMRAFLLGCGIDFCDGRVMRRLNQYLALPPTWKYLRRDPLWLSYYEPLLKRYALCLRQKQQPTLR